MKNKLANIILIIFFSITSNATTILGEAHAKFHGYSNLHNFVGTVESKKFVVEIENDLLSFKSVFPVINMDTKNKKRDRKMKAMFHVRKYPNITAIFTDVPLSKILEKEEFQQSIGINVKSKVSLLKATFKNIVKQNSILEFDVECKIRLHKIGLKAPSTMFGIMKVKNRIDTVTHFKLMIEK